MKRTNPWVVAISPLERALDLQGPQRPLDSVPCKLGACAVTQERFKCCTADE